MIKIVFSKTLEKVERKNARLVREVIPEEIDNMKTLCIVSEISAGNFVNHIIKSIEEKSSEMGVVHEVKTKRGAY